jgi:hypothetical protein
MNQMQNEITLKQLILKIGEWINFLYAKRRAIILSGIIGTVLGVTYSMISNKKYESVLTFALEEKGSGMSAYAGIASQFGIDLGKGGESGAFIGENIIELFKSRLIIENTLLQESEFNGEKQLLLNRYISYNKLDKNWSEVESTQNLTYHIGQNRKTFTRAQDSVLSNIYEKIRKHHLSVEKVDKKLNIITVLVSSEDEQFAKVFTELLVENVYKFYLETKTKKTRANVEILEYRVDSVKKALNDEMYQAAMNQDENINPNRSMVRVPYIKRQLNVQMLTTLYGELIKNLELSKLALMREEPLIQIIDRPIYPLKYSKPGKIKTGLVTGFVFGFITVLFFLFRKEYHRIMNNPA